MPRRPTPTASGRGAPSNRVLFAQRQLACSRYGAARAAVMEQFGVSRTTATRDLTEALRLMALEADAERPHLRSTMLSRLNVIMDRAQSDGKLEVAVRAAREIVRITGLAAPEHIVHHNAVADPTKYEDLSDEELDLLEKLDQQKAH